MSSHAPLLCAAELVQNWKITSWSAVIVLSNVLVLATPYYVTYKDTAKLDCNSPALAVAKASARCMKPTLVFLLFFANLRTPSRVR